MNTRKTISTIAAFMRRAVIVSTALFAFYGLIAQISFAAENNQTQEFREKYRLDDRGKEQIGGFVAPDINHSDFGAVRDINLTNFEAKELNVTRIMDGAKTKGEKDAKEVFDAFNSEKTQKRIDEMSGFILKDEAFGAYEYAGEYRGIIDDRLGELNASLPSLRQRNSQNRYLDKNEQIFIVLSSSIPDSAIRSFFEDIDRIGGINDARFIMRGVIGNEMPIDLKPTIKFMSRIVSRSGKPIKSANEDAFKVSISINPKITRKYNIDRVPAVLFIKNYNPSIEEPKSLGEGLLGNDEYYVSYGAAKLSYSLSKINETAKSEGLSRVINALNNSGFFNESKSADKARDKSAVKKDKR